MPDVVKVLVIAPAPLTDDWAGGISSFVRSFVTHMPDDFEVWIAGIERSNEAPSAGWREASIGGRHVRFLPVARLTANERRAIPVKARAMFGLVAARPRVPTNGFVVQTHAPALDLPLLMRAAPIIRVVHNSPDSLASPDSGTLWRHSGRLLRGAEQLAFSRAAQVYFVDRGTYLEYARHEPAAADRMRYLGNGIDTDEFAPRNAMEREVARTRLAAQFGIPATAPWLLFCGRLDRQKDPRLLIETFALARRLPGLTEAQLVIVGRGKLEDETRQAARAAGVAEAAHFVGTLQHDQLPLVMAAAHTLLLSSAYEGSPFVVLEALACGLPVVSTAVGDVPSLVRHEQTGWIAFERTAVELARGVAWAVAQRRDEIGPRAAASMSAYRIQDVLAPFYDAHRRRSSHTQVDRRVREARDSARPIGPSPRVNGHSSRAYRAPARAT